MKRLKWIEWMGFAAGIAAALAVWLTIHQQTAKPAAQQKDMPAGYTVTIVDDYAADTRSNRGSADDAEAPKNTSPQPDRSKPPVQQPAAVKAPDLLVRVYLTKQQRIEKVPLETYVRGVVAAELPASFHPASQEAQAIAARTYIVRRLLLNDRTNVPAEGADVTDTETHQVYRSLAEMNRLRTDDEHAWQVADSAVKRTKGKIIAYEGKPIEALYFSTSNGYTENSEEVFPVRLPYLRSVASPWDRQADAPRSEETIEMPLKEFYAKLGVRTLPVFARLSGYPRIQLQQKTKGQRIKTMTVGGKTFSGVEIREKLNLKSASFTWTVKGGTIRITTYGSGHGVGMSQWGAEGMAQAGYNAEEIIAHYYSGAELMEVSKLADAAADSP